MINTRQDDLYGNVSFGGSGGSKEKSRDRDRSVFNNANGHRIGSGNGGRSIMNDANGNRVTADFNGNGSVADEALTVAGIVVTVASGGTAPVAATLGVGIATIGYVTQ